MATQPRAIENNPLYQQYVRACRINSYLHIIDSQIALLTESRGTKEEAEKIFYDAVRKRTNPAYYVVVESLIQYEKPLDSGKDSATPGVLEGHIEFTKLYLQKLFIESLVYPLAGQPPFINWQTVVQSIRVNSINILDEKERARCEEIAFHSHLFYERERFENFMAEHIDQLQEK